MSRPHGECFITVDDDIIYIKSVGAFNLEGIIQAYQDIESIIISLGENRFKVLVDYTEIEGATPEAFDKLNECNEWLNSQNLIAKAVVIHSPVNLTLLESRVPARSLQNDKNFDNQSAAKEWLKQQQ
ncbi:hypothetical protein [Colwellia piezophila]|uniref:hypothetical protein n=1 Tax=Colwellia piezophila TaxID=211668 RepID=UPI0003609B19|nr:hypothetical protein [Colwellia piezophila]